MLAVQRCSSPNSAVSESICDNMTQTIGNTPLVRLSRIAAKHKVQADLIGKIEYFNPAGSIKDRPALAMLDALMASERFNQDTEIVEATSGNSGVACAWLCAIRQIPLTIVIPEHMSIERRKMIEHFGAKVVLTPEAKGTQGAIEYAKNMVEQDPNRVMLDQFSNQANPHIHFQSTASEIWRDTGGNVDVVVAGVGTGGTITGIARALKVHNPDIEIIAVEPASCPVLSKGIAGAHKIQGLSSGHVPDTLQVELLDRVIAISDDDAINWARELACYEGLAVGISSGAATLAAVQLGQHDDYANKRIVTILADSAERYFSTELFI